MFMYKLPPLGGASNGVSAFIYVMSICCLARPKINVFYLYTCSAETAEINTSQNPRVFWIGNVLDGCLKRISFTGHE